MPRNVLVTGAAQGIGRAIALRFKAAGARVGAFDVDEGVATLADQDIVTGRLDVTDPQQWADTLQSFTDGAPLDVLVNNAGLLQSGPFAQLPLQAQLTTVQVNVAGTLIGCHTAYPYLKRSDNAHVINLCSASAIYGQPGLATYSATKFAVRGLSEALELEWRDEGIAVHALWPLFVKTRMTQDMDLGTTRALGVRLTPEDVAKAAVQVCERGGGVHQGVGVQARTLMATASMSPPFMNRAVNKFLAGR